MLCKAGRGPYRVDRGGVGRVKQAQDFHPGSLWPEVNTDFFNKYVAQQAMLECVAVYTREVCDV